MNFSLFATEQKYKKYFFIFVAFFSFGQIRCDSLDIKEISALKQNDSLKEHAESSLLSQLGDKIKGVFTHDDTDIEQKQTSRAIADTVSSNLEKISDTISEKVSPRKPFSSMPGFMEKLPKFNIKIESIETDSSFYLNELNDNVVILFFTTTWCPNCPSVFQDLDTLQNKLDSMDIKNVKVITLIIDEDLNKNGVMAYFMMHNIKKLKQYRSISPNLVQNVVEGVPACLIRNKKGKIVWGYTGAANYQSQEFLNYVKQLSEK